LERDRQEVDSLRQLLTAALEKVPKALTTGETPFRRVVDVRRHYWSPDGIHNDVNGLLRRAFVRTFDTQCRL